MSENTNVPDWAYARRDLPDGRIILVIERIFNSTLTIGTGMKTFDDNW